MPEAPPTQKDPIVNRSMSGTYLIFALLLMASLLWALYNEFYGLRPWKSYQARFVQLYSAYLEKLRPQQAAAEKVLRQSEAFQKIERELSEAEKAATPRVAQIDREVNQIIDRQVAAMTEPFQTARGRVTADIYSMETSTSAGARERIRRRLEEFKRGPFEVELPAADASGRARTVSFTYDQLEGELSRLKERKAELLSERVEALKTATELRQKRDAYLQENLNGLTEQQVAGLIRKVTAFTPEIRQVNVLDSNIVDRCESCHLGIREPVVLTKASMGGEGAFTSHPNRDLLKSHDPERFGCTSCHAGNGRATTGVVKAHGRYHHWLWPMYQRENFEAGCQQCHTRDLVLKEADVLSAGKDLFRHKGCIACHKFEGYDIEGEGLAATRQAIHQLETQREETAREIVRATAEADRAPDNATASKLYARADNLRVTTSGIDTKIEELDLEAKSFLRDLKKVGPNLKEGRLKLRKEWIPVWIENPQAFRPTTKMPQFRLEKDDRQAIAAFIWQSGLQSQLPAQPPGEPARGKELFETRGCMACHSMGEGREAVGGTFAANLSRVGEKASYDYLVRWIHNPRERTVPYCPTEKRDIGPADYARKNLPFLFDLDHTVCPSCGHELQVQQMTVMPSLRLTWEEARDLASYLMTKRQKEPFSYPAAGYLDDPKLKERGKTLVQHYGCAACHEISGLEEEGRIGTELTSEGSKPIERLDFALLTHEAKRDEWYDHKGFFERKLADPAIFDKGKIKAPMEKLRMPNFHLKPEEVNSLSTFLLGSVDSLLPEKNFYRPADQRRDIQDGWWIVKKYNCMGCHQVQIGQASVLMSLPHYQDPDFKSQLPPTLIGEGARVDPNWLARFLNNPALSASDTNRNGVRPYLTARMPTFSFSQGEIMKLVRFFSAMATQPQPYIPPKLEPLNTAELTLARQLFTSPGAPCIKCHATGEPAHDRNATAPNFLLSKERLKPAWTSRWIRDPALMSPGTAMPSGLFKREGDRWVFAGPVPESLRAYDKDQLDLMVRYIFQFSQEELQRLPKPSSLPSASSSKRGPSQRSRIAQARIN